jgi:hypothetical protein
MQSSVSARQGVAWLIGFSRNALALAAFVLRCQARLRPTLRRCVKAAALDTDDKQVLDHGILS